jgi:hypothetical protein
VCDAIHGEYRQELFTLPSTPDEWREVSKRFATRWNFPHTLGAIDGKHIALKKPAKSGSTHHNYKGFCSIILLAVVDGNYNFMWASVGADGTASDTGVFNRSSLKRAFEQERLGLPPPEPIPGDDRDIPYFLVGDDAFAMRTWLMKPFAHRHLTRRERIFNYRLSRARRIVENGFGILCHRWRCLLTTLQTTVPNSRSIVQGCLSLHNLVRARNPAMAAGEVDQEDDQGNVVPGSWRDDVQLTDPLTAGGNRDSRDAKNQRNYLADYYNSAQGAVPWQHKIV